MAITSVGFDGTINEVQWAALSWYLGADYAVFGLTNFRVTAVTGQDRTVSISTGTAYGHGVLSTNDAPISLQLPVIASGTRWDLVALRRNWSTNTASVVSVQGTSTQTVPSGRNANPGVLDDQPLALVQVTAGQTLPTAVLDLRVFPSKVYHAKSLLAFPSPRLGTEVNVNDSGVGGGMIRYSRQQFEDGPAWVARYSLHSDTSTTPVNVANSSTTAVLAFSTNTAHKCSTGRVQLTATVVGSAAAAGISGEVRFQVDGTTLIGPPLYAYHAAAGGPGQITYSGSFLYDTTVGATRSFRLVNRKRSGPAGAFTVLAGGLLTIVDVEP